MPSYNAYAAKSAKSPLELFSFDPGELGPEEVEIKVTHCGICHSDLSMLDNDWGMSAYPFVPGHEVTGTVSALGAQAKGLKIGQKVGLGWFSHSCLSCHECLSGDHHLCSAAQGTIVARHGGFADRVRAQWTWVRPLPEGLDIIISTINAPLDVSGLLDTLRPKGLLHNLGAVLKPLEVSAFSLILGQKSVGDSPTGSPVVIDEMLEFSARHSIAPITETFPMSKVNDALERLRSGKARYRIVLVNDIA